MAYFTRSTKGMKALKLIIMPFLHERRLYVTRAEPQDKYFTTVITDSLEEERKTAILKLLHRDSEKGKLLVSMNIT